MNHVIDLENIKHKCRVCLTPSNQMIALTCKLDEENDESPQICNALESIFSTRVNIDSSYPEGVCLTCYKRIKISYDLKTIFKKSQYILENYVSVVNICSQDECDDFNGSQNPENLDEDVKDILDEPVEPEELFIKQEFDVDDFVKQETDEEELTDFVILQVTSDDDNQQIIESFKIQNYIEQDNEKDLENSTESGEITAEFIDPSKYHLEELVSKSKVSYTCPFCQKLLLTRRKLDQHSKICQKYPLEKCEFCEKEFSSLMRKHYHIKMKHPTDNPSIMVKCQICDGVFENLKARTYHIKTKHASKKFACKICGKAFHFKNGLATHMDTHSKDQFKEICPVCGKGFHYRGGLFYHMKIHRNERNYLCTYCSARFLNVSGLKKHIRIHTGEKPCQCEYCGKSFRSTSILNKHEKTHTGHRPHSCTYCAKGFISMYNLKVHMAGHSGNHPCVFCEKSFLNEDVLKLHMKFKHNVKDEALNEESSAE